MGACKFCGKDAGWFKNEHQTCRDLNIAGWQDMLHQASGAALGKGELSTLRDRLRQLAVTTRQSRDVVPNVLVLGWEEAAKAALDDKVLSHEDEAALMIYARTFNLEQSDLDKRGWYARTAMSAVLREVLNGGLPTRIETDGSVPFNFQKDEVLVWLFQGVPYHEM